MKMKEKISYKITPRNQPWRWGFRPIAQSDFGRSNKISFGESYRLIQITTITKRIPRQIQLTAFLRFVKVSSASCPACFERFSCTIPTTKKAAAHIKRTMSIQTTIILFLQSRKLSTLRPVRKGSVLRHRRSYWTQYLPYFHRVHLPHWSAYHIRCISLVSVFSRLKEESNWTLADAEPYIESLIAFYQDHRQTTFRVMEASEVRRLQRIPCRQVLQEIFDGKFIELKNGMLRYKQ